MPTLQERIEAATAVLESDAATMRAIVHGAVTDPDVITEGGAVAPLAKSIAGLAAAYEGDNVIGQAVAAWDGAVAAQGLAEDARNAAQAAAGSIPSLPLSISDGGTGASDATAALAALGALAPDGDGSALSGVVHALPPDTTEAEAEAGSEEAARLWSPAKIRYAVSVHAPDRGIWALAEEVAITSAVSAVEFIGLDPALRHRLQIDGLVCSSFSSMRLELWTGSAWTQAMYYSGYDNYRGVLTAQSGTAGPISVGDHDGSGDMSATIHLCHLGGTRWTLGWSQGLGNGNGSYDPYVKIRRWVRRAVEANTGVRIVASNGQYTAGTIRRWVAEDR